ncbi:VOC family protein [Paenibacillus gorillae]|uniref:VOC family protein n=1 Tax=Paenibacillus gorillae TaxID=1243662 RepID=UPI0004B0F120|nr:VOC family protein [Paenibacillus gorillae]
MYAKHKQKGIHHVCLRVPNLHVTANFYRNAFDAELVAEWGAEGKEDHAFILDLGTGDYLEIFGSSEPFALGKWQHVAIWTDNIEAAFEKAIASGATVASMPAISRIPTRSGQVVHMKYGFLNAPGGETVELIQHLEADASL